MATAKDILLIKGSRVATISPEATVYEAAVRMNEDRIGALVVLDQGQLVGMFTERDILQRVVGLRRDATQTLVQEVMSTEVMCCQPHTSLEEARGVMKNRRVRHLPVIGDDGNLVGLISIGDLNAYQTCHHEQTIYMLEQYIHGQT
jgi:CBS domain-containing protein